MRKIIYKDSDDNLKQRFDLFLKVDTEQVQVEFNSDLDSITISPNINRNVKISQKKAIKDSAAILMLSETETNKLERWLNYLPPVQILNHRFKSSRILTLNR